MHTHVHTHTHTHTKTTRSASDQVTNLWEFYLLLWELLKTKSHISGITCACVCMCACVCACAASAACHLPSPRCRPQTEASAGASSAARWWTPCGWASWGPCTSWSSACLCSERSCNWEFWWEEGGSKDGWKRRTMAEMVLFPCTSDFPPCSANKTLF